VKKTFALFLLAATMLASVPARAEADTNAAPASNSVASGRKLALRGYYLGIGPAALGNLNSSGVGYYLTTGYGFDVESVVIRLGVEYFGRSGALGVTAGLGASFFPLHTKDTAVDPYIGFDFGFGTTRTNDALFRAEWVDGFVLGPTLGVHLLRTADVNLDFGFKWGFFLSSGTLGSPNYGVFRVAVYF